MTGSSARSASVTDSPSHATGPAERQDQRPGSAGLVLAASCLCFFIVTMDATVVNVALPAIGRSLHGGIAGLQWVVDAYTLPFAAVLLSAGALSDRIGASRSVRAGVSLFTVASAPRSSGCRDLTRKIPLPVPPTNRHDLHHQPDHHRDKPRGPGHDRRHRDDRPGDGAAKRYPSHDGIPPRPSSTPGRPGRTSVPACAMPARRGASGAAPRRRTASRAGTTSNRHWPPTTPLARDVTGELPRCGGGEYRADLRHETLHVRVEATGRPVGAVGQAVPVDLAELARVRTDLGGYVAL
jgi:hypothetical protein